MSYVINASQLDINSTTQIVADVVPTNPRHVGTRGRAFYDFYAVGRSVAEIADASLKSPLRSRGRDHILWDINHLFVTIIETRDGGTTDVAKFVRPTAAPRAAVDPVAVARAAVERATALLAAAERAAAERATAERAAAEYDDANDAAIGG